jgi:hypothetical protein
MGTESQPAGADGVLPEGRGAFGGFIGPQNLLVLVKNTVPFLFESQPRDPFEGEDRNLAERANHRMGWWSILNAAERLSPTEEPTSAQWTDYFALCLAAHFATVASYVPTDVDTKIRDRLWFLEREDAEWERLLSLISGLAQWDVSSLSARHVMIEPGLLVSGHDGERLSVLCGGLLSLLRANREEDAARVRDWIDQELAREARAFEILLHNRGRDVEMLSLAATLTHNAGDVDQGLSARKGQQVRGDPAFHFGKLAHERNERYGGAFAKAAAVYRELLASEGHRHYPLRDVKALRRHRSLLLPLGPFFDEWGSQVATSPHLNLEERAQTVAALVSGIKRVKGQVGYFRALAGFDSAHSNGIEANELLAAMPASIRRSVKDKALRQQIAIRRSSFESGMSTLARKILANFRG